ncbi:response regulator transcription factor [Sphingomonas floccifaciens]|uniref:Response regulator transcription factor n=1 Tax=Sphingomonas floccifaciens TaxID=1844115 RepID=A0ABW4NAE0_9SPHN
MYVYIVDDEREVGASLATMLNKSGHMASCFLSGQAFLNVAVDLAPGCVLLDLCLLDQSGLEVQAQLATLDHGHAVVTVSGVGDIPDAVQAMRSGAIDFLRKPHRRAELFEVIERAAETVRTRMESRSKSLTFRRLDDLSTRECEVLEALRNGRPSKTVANLLNISVRTVDMHRANIIRKLGVSNMTAALMLARDAHRI